MEQSADVIIVGGGVIGNATAYYLAKKGISVIVLEGKDYIGEGSSNRNCGGVRQSGRDPRELPLAMWGIENLWPGLSDELEVNVEYEQAGNLRLGKTEKHRRILQDLTDRAVACGLDVRMIDTNEIKRINPYLSEEVQCASWCPTDGHANPMTTTLGYYKQARKLKVRFITGEKVIKIRKVHGKARQVITENNVYEGEKILVAAGYESRQILETVGIDVPMVAEKHETLVTEVQQQMFKQMLGTAEADFYGHQTSHGSFVFGGSTGLEPYNKDNGKLISCSNGASSICRSIMSYFPALSDAKIVRVWSGIIDKCADGVPVIDVIDEVEGLYTACAFSGHGFGIAPAVGYHMAELMLDGNLPVDISDMKYDRFRSKN